MYLLLSILCSTVIFIIFKCFEKYNVNTLQAIVINYFIAATFGFLDYNAKLSVLEITDSKWFIGALCLGALFITIFNVMALTAQKNGLSVTSVASKMSVVIPIIFGVYAYNESVNLQKLIGILLALAAVYLTSVKAKSLKTFQLKNLSLPIILFLGSGTIDTSIKYLETKYLADNEIPVFSATIFLCSGLIGVILLTIKSLKTPLKLSYKPLIGGAILGVVNYYAILTLLKALQINGFESSTLFTLNNVGIVMLSTLIGLLFFKEKLIRKNWIGIALAIISIGLVTFA